MEHTAIARELVTCKRFYFSARTDLLHLVFEVFIQNILGYQFSWTDKAFDEFTQFIIYGLRLPNLVSCQC